MNKGRCKLMRARWSKKDGIIIAAVIAAAIIAGAICGKLILDAII